jgi:hypothetical protein
MEPESIASRTAKREHMMAGAEVTGVLLYKTDFNYYINNANWNQNIPYLWNRILSIPKNE